MRSQVGTAARQPVASSVGDDRKDLCCQPPSADTVVRMLISTTNELPGYEIEEVLGEVFGLTVRSRHAGSQLGAWLKSLAGGELKGMTKMLIEGRQHATERLVEEAASKYADAIVAFRFDSSELGGTWTEICAYGTAVKVRKLS
jgi:uncharacterized protein YbjQ (UPF0145 family)